MGPPSRARDAGPRRRHARRPPAGAAGPPLLGGGAARRATAGPMTAITLGIESPRQAEVMRLIEALDVYQSGLYPPESNHFLDVEALAATERAVLRREAGRAGAGLRRAPDRSGGMGRAEADVRIPGGPGTQARAPSPRSDRSGGATGGARPACASRPASTSRRRSGSTAPRATWSGRPSPTTPRIRSASSWRSASDGPTTCRPAPRRCRRPRSRPASCRAGSPPSRGSRVTTTWAGMASMSARMRQRANASGSAGCQKLPAVVRRHRGEGRKFAGRRTARPASRVRGHASPCSVAPSCSPPSCSPWCRPSPPDVTWTRGGGGLNLAQNRCVARTPALLQPALRLGRSREEQEARHRVFRRKDGSARVLVRFAAPR